MDHDDPPANRRKLKFAPKSASQRKPRLAAPKPKTSDDGSNEDEAAKAQKLMTRFNENLKRQATRADKKAAPVEVAFGSGASPSLSIRKFGYPKAEASHVKASAAGWDSDPDAMQIDGKDEGAGHGAIDLNRQRTRKKYKEPFVRRKIQCFLFCVLKFRTRSVSATALVSFAATVLPDVLNEEEFGKDAMNSEYDENFIKHASELGLLEKSDEAKMLLFKFPPKMPYINRSIISAKGKEKVGSSSSSIQSQCSNCLSQLPEGYMGKMVVYKSGAVKLKIGDVLYDVAQGSDCTFHQQVMAVNTEAKQCSEVGEIEKHAVVSFDVDSILDSVINLD
ncbi:unnamed protein product [Linum tenue]|uniref:DNA-directed RNA polymerase III subunit RPC4 n=1 Tax=Linum tenue TaxID=586396 RepID=A0AAV0H845_9ROSI|nr:unnamed protein product [Linum tenue]